MKETRYDGIAAKMMGVRFQGQIHAFAADGTEYKTPMVEGSIRDYLMEAICDDTRTEATRRMAANMLYYGAQAQSYFNYDAEHPVSEPANETEAAALAQFPVPEAPVPEHTVKHTGEGPQLSQSVLLENRITVEVSLITESHLSDVAVIVKDASGNEVTRLQVEETFMPGAYVSERFAGVSAKTLREVFSFQAVDGEGNALSQTMLWSMDAYTAECQVGDSARDRDMANAILSYGDAVVAYFEEAGQNQP